MLNCHLALSGSLSLFEQIGEDYFYLWRVGRLEKTSRSGERERTMKQQRQLRLFFGTIFLPFHGLPVFVCHFIF